jgi:hypothetical protein
MSTKIIRVGGRGSTPCLLLQTLIRADFFMSFYEEAYICLSFKDLIMFVRIVNVAKEM